MTNLPYVLLNDYKLDDNAIEEYYQTFKKYSDNILYRDNAGTAPKITTVYGHDDFIKNNDELVYYKNNTLNVIAEKFLEDFSLDLRYNTFILTTKENGILDWHIDGAGSAGSPQAAFMYDFRDTKRAPTIFNYNSSIYTLEGYKAALINTSTLHKVDNTNHGRRYNLRISFYGQTFEKIRDQIIRKLTC